MLEISTLQERLELVQERIADAAPVPGRVTLVAVTKRFSAEVVDEARQVGLEDLGENYAQELVTKADELSDFNLRWHFIGGLQRNKIKKIADLVSLWHTVDRPEIVTEIAKRAPGASILIQVNTTQEAQKAGCDLVDTAQLVDYARSCELNVRGLMTMGPSDQSNPAPAFERLRKLSEELEVVELSMGMSADLEVALAEGATIVRVGSALFGPRSTR